MFRVPDSSPPLTPDPARGRKKGTFISPAHPSTTPLGPPPTSFTAASTTPAGQPPPSSIFGSESQSSRHQSPSILAGHRARASNGSPERPIRRRAADYSMDMDGVESYEDTDAFGNIVRQDDIILKRRPSHFAAIARSFIKPQSVLAEPNYFILQTENTLDQLHASLSQDVGQPTASADDLARSVQHLLQAWDVQREMSGSKASTGPEDNFAPWTKAAYLASLLFVVYQPTPTRSRTDMLSTSGPVFMKPMPEVLLQWLRTYHNPFPNDYEDLYNYSPNPTASERFWDVMYNTALRGDFPKVIQLLKLADFREAVTSLDDASESIGYEGAQLEAVERVIHRAVQILESCPAVCSGDWNVTNTDWTSWRSQIRKAKTELQTLASGPMAKDLQGLGSSHGSAFGQSTDSLGLSRLSRQGQVVPRVVYQNLLYLYGQLLGTRTEIAAAANDWLEATIGNVAWWDGDEQDDKHESLAVSQRKRRPYGARPVDINSQQAYQEELCQSLRSTVIDDPEGDLAVDTTRPVEVAMACLFEGEIASTIGIMQSLSLAVAAAVVDIGSLGGWLSSSFGGANDLPPSFDASDLMVLSYAPKNKKGQDKDDILSRYASLLATKPLVTSSNNSLRREEEGWKLAIAVLGRLTSQATIKEKISQILSEIELSTDDRVEQAVTLCGQLGLTEQAHKIAERYADGLLSGGSSQYGSAIIYYSRAHATSKLRELLNYLISCSIIQSSPFPASTNSSDNILSSLLLRPRATIDRLSHLDSRAADILSTSIAGYATLLRFYNLRDGAIAAVNSNRAAAGPIARKKAAVNALIALVQSAADSIHGGLFDVEITSAVPVDALTCLLGEALPFLGDPDRSWLDANQLTSLLSAVESLESAPLRVRESCEACFVAALDEKYSTAKSSASKDWSGRAEDMLKKSVSGLTTTSSGYEIIGSGLLKSDGSAAVSVERGWDWRDGLPRDTKAESVLKILRVQVAREIGKAWTA